MRMPVLNKWLWLYVQLFLMMCMMMAVSFLSDGLHGFLGDILCSGTYRDTNGYLVGCKFKTMDTVHGPTWHWGWRHWLLILFGIAFCIINICRMYDKWDERSKA